MIVTDRILSCANCFQLMIAEQKSLNRVTEASETDPASASDASESLNVRYI